MSARLRSFGDSPAPADEPEISTLARALNPKELSEQLKLVSHSQWRDALREVRIQILKQRSSKRCTFKVALQADLIGKVYAKGRQDVYQVMEAISRAGFGSDAEFSIPQPIAYLASLRLLLQEEVEGTPAKSVFTADQERSRASAAERCGRWLARLHALAPPPGQVLDVEGVLRRSERKARLVSEKGGDLAAKSGELVDRLKAAAPSLGKIPVCPGHGDYTYHQIIFAGRRTVVCDWDAYDVADPTRDVARFIVHLERLAARCLGSIRKLDGAAQVFLRTYVASGGHAQVAAHLPFYKAADYLEEAEWELRTKRHARWRTWAEVMLNEGLRSLDRCE